MRCPRLPEPLKVDGQLVRGEPRSFMEGYRDGLLDHIPMRPEDPAYLQGWRHAAVPCDRTDA